MSPFSLEKITDKLKLELQRHTNIVQTDPAPTIVKGSRLRSQAIAMSAELMPALFRLTVWAHRRTMQGAMNGAHGREREVFF